ncbi:Hsp70 family protein [Krasilnikovia cinnamomea]|uniref:Hsp70 family protein n=1 Tax=Krasilnikovia cinnamomea TaxID=349313 RepID=UPI001A91EB15|nr:Hsp70 family protein [Krasilnikovia cinnamomea]
MSIDFGTSNTAAAYRRGGGDPVPIMLTNDAHQMPSAVLVTPDGIQVGATARRSARRFPDGFERSPKRLIGQDTTYLGGRDVPVQSLVAAVLRAVAAKASEVGGDDRPDSVLLTYPQDWAGPRRDVLRAAALEAGFAPDVVRLIPEPVAAVAYHAHTTPPPPGAAVAVFDFGGGTCDVAVLRAADADNPADLRVLASAGADPLGGDVIDHLLATAVLARLDDRDRGDLVQALRDPANAKALHRFRNEVEVGKRELSENEQARVMVELGDDEEIVTITRAEFDELIAPQIRRAIELTERTLAQAQVAVADLHKLYLTGGSSYLLAVQREMTAMLGRSPEKFDDPKLVVALGAHHAAAAPPTKASPERAASQASPPDPRQAAAPARPAPAPARPAATPPAPERAAAPPPETEQAAESAVPVTASLMMSSAGMHAARAVASGAAGLSAAAQRVLMVNPALMTALAATPEGPATVDDLPTLAALMCVPGLLDQVCADPGLIGRLRGSNTLLKIPQARPGGVPLPIRVFFGDSPYWLRAYEDPAARRRWDDSEGPGDIWAVRTMRTWCTATTQEQREILLSPQWATWVPGEHYLDAFHHGDGDEPDTIWLPPAIERPSAVAPKASQFVRPAHPTPQQEAYLRDLAEAYAPAGGGGLAAATARQPDSGKLVRARLGELPANFRCQVELMGVAMTGFSTELLFYQATATRPSAVVIPFNGGTYDMTTGRIGWGGFPIILTPDVVTGVRIKTDWANAQRRIVVSTCPRPGASCPPSGADLQLRTGQLNAVANRIRAHLGRP